MKHRLRAIVIGIASGAVVLALLLAGVFYSLQTNWFKNRVREEFVAAAERVSGGRVEIRRFNYDWRTLTAEFGNVVIRGNEPASAPPLFRAASVKVGLKVVSVFRRKIDIASLVVKRPEVDISVRPDGSTNIPATNKGPGPLLALKVERLQVEQGTIQVNVRRVPLDIRGENTSLLLTYDGTPAQYHANLSSGGLRLSSNLFPLVNGTVSADAELARDRISILTATLKSKDAAVQASGTIQHFTQPVLDLQVKAQANGTYAAALARIPDVHGGTVSLTGRAHYDEAGGLGFQGNAGARDVEYRFGSLGYRSVDVESSVTARGRQVKFTHLALAALGAKVSGDAVIRPNDQLEFDGTLSGLTLRDAAPLFLNRKLPWSGAVNGPVHLKTKLARQFENIALRANLRITPAAGGMPVWGNVDFAYSRPGGRLVFQDSQINLPHSRVSFAGAWGGSLQTVFDSTDLNDVKPTLAVFQPRLQMLDSVSILPNGSVHFDGTAAGSPASPKLAGNVALTRFRARGQTWDRLRAVVSAAPDAVDFSSLTADEGNLHLTASGHAGLQNWTIQSGSPLRLEAQFQGADLVEMAQSYFKLSLPLAHGSASGSIRISGSIAHPRGSAIVAIADVSAYGERLNQVEADVAFSGDRVEITRGLLKAGPALLSFTGSYRRNPNSWRNGQAQLKVDSNGFPLASLAPIRRYEPGLNAQFEIHGTAAALVTPGRIQPANANGSIVLRKVTLNNTAYGDIGLRAATSGQILNTNFSGDLKNSRFRGSAEVRLAGDDPINGQVQLSRIDLSTLAALLHAPEQLPLGGFVKGGLTFAGPLQHVEQLHAEMELQDVQLTSNLRVARAARMDDLVFRNADPVMIALGNGLASIRSFQIVGTDTRLDIGGSLPYKGGNPMNVKVNGAVDLRILQLFSPIVRSAGQTRVSASIAGTWAHPSVTGGATVSHGSLFLNGVPSGLNALNGSIKFDRDRATIEKLTAQSGGGELSFAGFVSFGQAGPPVYRLEANAQDVRLRYAGSVSVTATSQLRLSGTPDNAILSGTATISRVVLNPNSDLGNLLASVAVPAAAPGNEKNFLSGLQFDVHVESAPNLQLDTALSRDVQANVDLRLRGTPDHPILLGSISADQGDVRVFGTKYAINRGEVDFESAVKIEPVLDLDLRTQVRGVVVDITISGVPGKLNINYRSDPPLQPRDIIALLTVGRTPGISPNLPQSQVTNDIAAVQSGGSATVLGQAISPNSNRLSKLFGITNIKIDPMVQGITYASQARVTLEQQISRQITVTYVTNLSQTSEQIFRLEWAFSAQYSVVALRDDNGEFGIDIQYRKRFK